LQKTAPVDRSHAKHARCAGSKRALAQHGHARAFNEGTYVFAPLSGEALIRPAHLRR
jgi:hypothetical protein